MPILTTDIATAQQDYRGLQKRPDAAKVTGKYGILEAVYTTTGAEATGDIIDIGQIPEGAVVIPEESAITTEAVGGTTPAISKIGDSGDDDRYSATSITLASLARVAVTPALATSIITRTPVTAATNTIKATFTLASGTLTAAKKIVFTIKFRHP